MSKRFLLVVAFVVLVFPAFAAAHLERPSYWPDPAPDTSIDPPAGGEVPKARTLGSAASGNGPGDVRVVCKGDDGRRSLFILKRSIRRATTKGYSLRPSQPDIPLGEKRAVALLRINKALAQQCDYESIQEAVLDSGNQDRIVIMPGRYTEPDSRRAPTNDPRCAELTQIDNSGAATPSVEYHATCPNDQNLIYVQGRAIKGEPPSPPLSNRHGIPDAGRCLRCNLQVEGSGVKPTDVVLDAAERGEDRRPAGEPGPAVKDVVMRVDRADGFVARNVTFKGAHEHGIYIEEVDGYLLDKTKWFWNADYGNLTFTSDHGLYKNCDGYGSGDSNFYPGAAPETGEQATDFYPDAPRYNTTVKKCDSRGSALGYSGSMGNAVRITDSHFYGNGTGIASDTISAGGHPGYPLDSMKIDHNFIYSNNLNLYQGDAPVDPTVGVPSGAGIILAGANNTEVNDNFFFDNWFRGTMLLAIPDALVTPEGDVDPGISCQTAPTLTTSCNNRFFDNKMGVAPAGFEFPAGKDINPYTSKPDGGENSEGSYPNGTDFYWDEFASNTGNCWYDNTGIDGTRESVIADPPLAPSAGVSLPKFLPEDCGSSMGLGDVGKEMVLLQCSMWSRGDTADQHPDCDWFTVKQRPGSAAAARAARRDARNIRLAERSPEAAELRDQFEELSAFVDRP